MTWLQLIAWTAGIRFAVAAVGLLGIIALFALADREAEKQKRGNALHELPPPKVQP